MSYTLFAKSAALLSQELNNRGIPIEQYGQGCAKTMDQLYQEIGEGECSLTVDDKGRITRLTEVLALDVYRGNDKLQEKKQRFHDGRERTRNLDSTLGEKLKPGEAVLETAVRIAVEELPFLIGFPIKFLGIQERCRESQSYPGILTLYRFHRCEVRMPASESHDVMVVETDKTVFYNWEPI